VPTVQLVGNECIGVRFDDILTKSRKLPLANFMRQACFLREFSTFVNDYPGVGAVSDPTDETVDTRDTSEWH
jgi:hypothetical protein